MEIALAGNPNVGKSVVFSKLTGVGVISSNYPGTTVEFFEGKAKFMGSTITVIDLPGTYSLAGNTDDERVATNLLFERRPNTVIAVPRFDEARTQPGPAIRADRIRIPRHRSAQHVRCDEEDKDATWTSPVLSGY